MHEPNDDPRLSALLDAWGKRKDSAQPRPQYEPATACPTCGTGARRPGRPPGKASPQVDVPRVELAAPVFTLPGKLSSREMQVLAGIALGETCEETAARLFLSANTIKTHRARIYTKLGIVSAGQAGALAAKAGLV